MIVNQISHQGDAIEIEFVIKDSGIGIPPLKMIDLFKPFSQLDSSMARKYGGTGLGLAICKTLVELMGGNIHAEEAVEHGAIFIFTIQTKSFYFAAIPSTEIAAAKTTGKSSFLNCKITHSDCR